MSGCLLRSGDEDRGDHPDLAVLLLGGVLLSDGTTTWFGEAVTK